MYRNGKGKNINDGRLHNRFCRVERKGSPGRRIGTLVMNDMKYIKQFRMMHHAVCPVKISIVYQQHQRKSQPEIKQPMFMYIAVNSSVRLYKRKIKHQRHQRKKYKRNAGINNFPLVIFIGRPALLNFIKYFYASAKYKIYQMPYHPALHNV